METKTIVFIILAIISAIVLIAIFVVVPYIKKKKDDKNKTPVFKAYMTKYHSSSSEPFKFRNISQNNINQNNFQSFMDKYNFIAATDGFKSIATKNCTYNNEDDKYLFLNGTVMCSMLSGNNDDVSASLFLLLIDMTMNDGDFVYNKETDKITIAAITKNNLQILLGLFTPVHVTITQPDGTIVGTESVPTSPAIISYNEFKQKLLDIFLVIKSRNIEEEINTDCSSCDKIKNAR